MRRLDCFFFGRGERKVGLSFNTVNVRCPPPKKKKPCIYLGYIYIYKMALIRGMLKVATDTRIRQL